MGRMFALVFVVGSIVVAYSFALRHTSPFALNTASAQELLEPIATSSLTVAPEEAWMIPDAQPDAAAVQDASAPGPKPQNTFKPEAPVRIIIPSIDLDAPIVGVGLTRSGAMAVPSGTTENIGWYKKGPKPGQIGSSVLDAHVFAGFSELGRVKSGSEIILETSSGQRLRFLVDRIRTYALSDLTSQMLFGNTGERMLNLITCAGSLTADRTTYTHRLVVYAVYAGVV